MPMYYFRVRDQETLVDGEGTELANDSEARHHAKGVVRELMFRRDRMLDDEWSAWSMSVHDKNGVELFSFPFTDKE